VPDYTIDGISLSLPANRLTPTLIRALETGRYENSEAAALRAHLLPADRYLDLGAGAGYLLAQAARIVTKGRLSGIEASREMVDAARANVARNGVNAELRWGAVVPDDHAGDEAAFHERPAFWASALAQAGSQNPDREHAVPALRFRTLLKEFRPTALSIDIEGGEAALFDRPLPRHVRLVVMELHPGHYGGTGVKRIFDGLSASGFAYAARGSRGATVVFTRVAEA
jgi:FkbM family methyltransferase